jgi:cobalt/nickel transport system permease protein
VLLRPVPMHIPDGFLSTLVAVVFWILSALGVALALRRAGKDLGERQVPFMGVMAAAIFAAQMLNFSVAGGTSGHLLGAAIATILLGPWPAVIVLTTVVSIQALIFQDGGLLALGANLFNMAIVGVAVSHFVYASLRRLLGGRLQSVLASGFVAAWASIFVASLAAALQVAISGTSPANVAVPAMAGIHALIGVGEGLITVGTLAFLAATRRDLVQPDTATRGASGGVWAFGLGIAVLLSVLSPLASAHPDGLEWVAEQEGFLEAARAPLYNLIPDYIFPGISNEVLATILAAIVGTLIVFGVALGIAYLRRHRNLEVREPHAGRTREV